MIALLSSRRQLTAIAMLLGGLTGLPARAQERTQPPNILVLVADDLGWRDLGIYGNPGIRTPNIDRLARSGLMVERAFGVSPQCSPSRLGVLTGRYPHTTRTEDLHVPLPDGERILPSYLQWQG